MSNYGLLKGLGVGMTRAADSVDKYYDKKREDKQIEEAKKYKEGLLTEARKYNEGQATTQFNHQKQLQDENLAFSRKTGENKVVGVDADTGEPVTQKMVNSGKYRGKLINVPSLSSQGKGAGSIDRKRAIDATNELLETYDISLGKEYSGDPKISDDALSDVNIMRAGAGLKPLKLIKSKNKNKHSWAIWQDDYKYKVGFGGQQQPPVAKTAEDTADTPPPPPPSDRTRAAVEKAEQKKGQYKEKYREQAPDQVAVDGRSYPVSYTSSGVRYVVIDGKKMRLPPKNANTQKGLISGASAPN